MDIIHPEDREKVTSAIDTLIENGGSLEHKHRVFDRDGHILSISSKTTLIRNSDSQPVQLIGVIWNTADETERDVSLSGLRTVQEDLGIGFFSFDVENNAPHWNEPMYKLLGYDALNHTPSVESLLQKVDPSNRQEVSACFRAALEHGHDFEIALTLLRSDGRPIECACRAHVRRRSDAKVSHIFGSLVKLETSQSAVSNG